ncbi:Uu.00g122800.m01.CDS01 [Anthostomella pinea]|uniref:Uu.00g122800.m01.CDS01 n=1 Tax=Anthostomella pinea TaxID=933095 RepID=A0AAI8VHY6_9PEZI|nr:Uu.00g122800.m01.CDS01 [Anthostomella pinea]
MKRLLIGRLQKYLKDNPPGAKELEDESEAVERSTNNAALFREATLRSGLRISDDDIDNAEMTFATQSYTAWLQDNLKSQDWFALHVMNIPRYFGWKMLAATLARSPKTKKDTPFYRYWVEPNNDIEFGVRLSNFLDNNEARYYSPENYRTWTKLFREGLKHEIDSFNSAIGKTLKDVPEGQLWAKLRWKYIQMRIKAKKIFG